MPIHKMPKRAISASGNSDGGWAVVYRPLHENFLSAFAERYPAVYPRTAALGWSKPNYLFCLVPPPRLERGTSRSTNQAKSLKKQKPVSKE